MNGVPEDALHSVLDQILEPDPWCSLLTPNGNSPYLGARSLSLTALEEARINYTLSKRLLMTLEHPPECIPHAKLCFGYNARVEQCFVKRPIQRYPWEHRKDHRAVYLMEEPNKAMSPKRCFKAIRVRLEQ